MKYVACIILILILLLCGICVYLKISYPQTPLSSSTRMFAQHLLSPHKKLDKEVLGFLPYWKIEDLSSIQLNSLSEVNYFGLMVDANGDLIQQQDTQTEPGWREWNTQETGDFVTKAHIMGTKVSLSIVCQDNETIEALLNNPDAQTNLIKQIGEQISSRNLDGINIDFEYLGEPDAIYQERFTEFSKRLSTKFKAAHSNLQLTLSIMPRSARDQDLFDFAKLVPLYDRFIGMSYDYYGASADVAGPGAPMQGYKENKYFFDVQTTYEDYRKFIPKEKIIMGVAYYGWDRAVTDKDKLMSTTYSPNHANNYAAIISYARMKKENITKTYDCVWESVAQETWCRYIDPETQLPHQVWLADEKSIGTRFNFAKKQQFGGIAIWHLGYDTGYNDLFSLIHKSFSN